jgi:hypothetical protein
LRGWLLLVPSKLSSGYPLQYIVTCLLAVILLLSLGIAKLLNPTSNSMIYPNACPFITISTPDTVVSLTSNDELIPPV